VKRVSEVTSIHLKKADDWFIACSGFEDRCLAFPQVADGYRARLATLIKFIPNKPQRSLDYRKLKNTEALKAFLEARSEEVIEISVTRYNPLELDLAIDTLLGGASREARTITVDISCFTRIQLVFLLRTLFSQPGRTIRLIYSTPAYYASLDKRDIASGFDGLLLMPYQTTETSISVLSPDTVLIAALGHEGARCLLAWRSLEPTRTMLVLPDDKRSPDITRLTEIQNQELIEHYRAGDPTFSLYRCNPLAVRSVARRLSRVFEDVSLYDDRAMITFVPGGPKPLVASFAIAASATRADTYVAYPLVSGYDPAYSTGIGSVFEMRIRTPLTLT